MKKRLIDALIHAIGWFVLLIGIIGLFLPFLQGIILIILGLYIVSLRSERVKRMLEKLTDKHPKVRRIIELFDAKVRQIFSKKKT